MIQILYDYNTEYMTKHSAACCDLEINNTGKTWLSFHLSIVYQVSWPNDNSNDFTIYES